MPRGLSLEEVNEQVTEEDIAAVVATWAGIPVGRLLHVETEKLIGLEAELGRRLVSQERAVAAVSEAVRRNRAGIADLSRPTDSFLFLGPAGVGKTELAKALAEFLFDDERSMVRIDMSRTASSRRDLLAHPRLHRLRAGWAAQRGGAPPTVRRGAPRRD